MMNHIIRCTLSLCLSIIWVFSKYVSSLFSISLTTYCGVMYFVWQGSGSREPWLSYSVVLWLVQNWILYLCFFHIGAIYYVVILVILFLLFYCPAVCEGLNHKDMMLVGIIVFPNSWNNILCCTLGIVILFLYHPTFSVWEGYRIWKCTGLHSQPWAMQDILLLVFLFIFALSCASFLGVLSSGCLGKSLPKLRHCNCHSFSCFLFLVKGGYKIWKHQFHLPVKAMNVLIIVILFLISHS